MSAIPKREYKPKPHYKRGQTPPKTDERPLKPLTSAELAQALNTLKFAFTWALPPDYSDVCMGEAESALCGQCDNYCHSKMMADLKEQGRMSDFQLVDGLPLKEDSSLTSLFLLSFHSTTQNCCYLRAAALAALWLHYGITDDAWVMVGTVRFYNSRCHPFKDEPHIQQKVTVGGRRLHIPDLTVAADKSITGVHHSWVERCIGGQIWCYDTTGAFRMLRDDYYRLYDIRDAKISQRKQDFWRKVALWQTSWRRHHVLEFAFLVACLDITGIPFGAMYGDFGWEVFRTMFYSLFPDIRQRKTALSDDFLAVGHHFIEQEVAIGGNDTSYRITFSHQYACWIEDAVKRELLSASA
ncbi:MAG: hypothetical protein LBM12_01180 [Candidatus Nomurabacteria bacterium]|jgi:hypothetical protein|nr:hypothetical protein [Candidatus Nomurabacteria bacterium]